MKMEKPYIFSFETIREGDIFKDYKTFFYTVTGRNPPSGKTGRELKVRLSRYCEYCPNIVVDPTETRKNAIRVTKIYDTPLEVEENRGRRGKYADLLTPLILAQNEFTGTIGELCNYLRIFKEYFDYRQRLPENQRCYIKQNLWKPLATDLSAVREVKRHLKYHIQSTVKHRLEAMAKAGKIEYKEYRVIIPNAMTSTDGAKGVRPKAHIDFQKDMEARIRVVANYLQDMNCVLDIELLKCLDVGSAKWVNEVYPNYDDLKFGLAYEGWKSFPIRASTKQEAAIDNFERFLRQHTYKEVYKESCYLEPDLIPNKWDFFNNAALSSKYEELFKELFPILTNCEKTWPELQYKVIDPPEVSLDSTVLKEYAFDVSRKFLDYLEAHIGNIYYTVQKRDIDDMRGFGKCQPLCQISVARSKSAMKFVDQLKELYAEPSTEVKSA